jgi:hypothetical protein
MSQIHKLISKAHNGLWDARSAMEDLNFGIEQGFVLHKGVGVHRSIRSMIRKMSTMRVQLLRIEKKLLKA